RMRILSRAISSTRLKNAKLFLLLFYFTTAIFNYLHKLKTRNKALKAFEADRTSSKPAIPALIKTIAPKRESIRKRLKAKPIPVSTPNLLSPFLLARRNV
ncbi:hypothetical protein GGTG_08244, partial [Gaeumannomyces tritici R3-111a-1]